ncbi:flagellar transcriptional regulator FlhD, partial [Salmonella enterica subsp. enterica serovar Virginia]|nr:flagellar transcriptional regulator FlhD [Salmonella enterica subsp. enterica serovar Virginia]
FRLGINEEMANTLGALTLPQMVKLAETNQLVCHFRFDDHQTIILKTLPLAKIPGVGKVSAAKLENMGLRTCGDIQQCDLAMLLKR